MRNLRRTRTARSTRSHRHDPGDAGTGRAVAVGFLPTSGTVMDWYGIAWRPIAVGDGHLWRADFPGGTAWIVSDLTYVDSP